VDQRDLVARASRGDHDAFAALVDGSVARLELAARLILRDSELARDAVQEAMVSAWRHLPGLRDPERFDAWLHRLTIRSCLDIGRRRRRRVIEVELTPIDDIHTADASTWLADRDLIDRALQQLDPDQRAVVVLRYYLQLTLPEAAEALGIPLGTAKSRLHRALASLRVDVQPDGPRSPSQVTGDRYA
jgi:RNA polymerase sigma-70 factor (ECF subfamily)